MRTRSLALLAVAAAAPLSAQETREMDAHVHGVSTLELAVEGGMLEMALTSPGMDIVGFEYAARSDADKDAVEAALRTMLAPENIVTLPDSAGCRLTEVMAQLATEAHDHDESEMHDDHGHDDQGKGEAHDDHAEGEEHAHEGEHAHGDEDHAGDTGARHTEFQASYAFSCEHPEDLTTIGFSFFERFENAQEIEARYVTDAGAGSAGIDRDAPELTLN